MILGFLGGSLLLSHVLPQHFQGWPGKLTQTLVFLGPCHYLQGQEPASQQLQGYAAAET